MPQVGKNNSRYVAFLRGINVGGHGAIKMTDLKAAFDRMGFNGVKTVLASGNVVFEAPQADEKGLRIEIESGLKKAFRRDISVLLRNRDDLRQLRSSEPFKRIEALPGVQLYVTFLSKEALGATQSAVGWEF